MSLGRERKTKMGPVIPRGTTHAEPAVRSRLESRWQLLSDLSGAEIVAGHPTGLNATR